MEQFKDLQAWDLLIESRQYRTPESIKSLNLRNVADFAFLDLMSLYILHNQYETAPIASRYAEKTISFKNFSKPKLSGTDLYVSLNILMEPKSIFSQRIQQNVEADEILRNKLKVNLPTVKRYLDLLTNGKITETDAASLLLKIEKQLNVTESKLKSIRRLVQEWPSLTQTQRDLVTARMTEQYRRYAKRSELSVFINEIAKEKIDLEKLKQQQPGLLAAFAPWVALYGGYKLGYHLFGPKEDK